MNPIFLALISAILFGAAAPCGKALLSSFQPFHLAGLLYLGAAFFVAPIVVPAYLNSRKAGGRGAVENDSAASGADGSATLSGSRLRATSIRVALALAAGGVVAPVLLMVALTAAPAASVSIWLSLEAPLTALLAWLFFREHIGKTGAIGIAGVTLAAGVLAAGEGAAGFYAGSLSALACLCWALDNNLTAVIDGLSPTQLTFLKGLVAGSINLSIGLVLEPSRLDWQAIAIALSVGALSYGLSLVCYIKAAQRLGAARSQMIFASAPFWGVALSAIGLKEPVTAVQAGAALLLIGSLSFMLRERHAHFHSHEALAHTHEHTHDDGHHDHHHEDESLTDAVNGGDLSLANAAGGKGRENRDSGRHSHFHVHEPIAHAHPHWPDLHHRHDHDHDHDHDPGQDHDHDHDHDHDPGHDHDHDHGH